MHLLMLPLAFPFILSGAFADRRQAYRLAKMVAFRRRRGVPSPWSARPGVLRGAMRVLRWVGR